MKRPLYKLESDLRQLEKDINNDSEMLLTLKREMVSFIPDTGLSYSQVEDRLKYLQELKKQIASLEKRINVYSYQKKQLLTQIENETL